MSGVLAALLTGPGSVMSVGHTASETSSHRCSTVSVEVSIAFAARLVRAAPAEATGRGRNRGRAIPVN
jgi:hypothetical protein